MTIGEIKRHGSFRAHGAADAAGQRLASSFIERARSVPGTSHFSVPSPSCVRRRRGFTNDQFGRHGEACLRLRFTPDLFKQSAHRQPADLGRIGAHGGQRPVGLHSQIIEAHHAHALRHFNARHGQGSLAPSATRSFVAIMAVGRGFAARILCIARYPDSMLD